MNESVVNHLRDKVASLDIEPVVVGGLPALNINCVALKPNDGYESTRYFGLVASDEPLVEVVIRNESYPVGQAQYLVISKALDMYRNPDESIMSCFLIGSPGYLGADTAGFHEWHLILHLTVL